jgi:putative DNA methylase
LEDISRESAREKSIRHGHISTLHIWWARRPLAACRAAVFAALVNAPDDPAERERLEKLIATIVDWDQVKDGNSPAIEEAQRVIREQWGEETPRVLDMFAGGGAIPLEALRLGCEAHALELNPVAYLILLCTLVYPQKYGRVSESANRRIAEHATRNTQYASRLPGMEQIVEASGNPLADDVRYWGQRVLEETRKEIGHFYEDPDGDTVVAYLWARTARCPNPACGGQMPLVRQWWLARRGKRKRVALKPVVDRERNEVTFEVVQGDQIDFDPGEGTMRHGSVTCLFCGQTTDAGYLRSEGKAGRLGQMPLAVVLTRPGKLGKAYRTVTDADRRNYAAAEATLERIQANASEGLSPVPDEPIPTTELRRLSVPLYGMDRWGKLFNTRQALTLVIFSRKVHAVYNEVARETGNDEYARSVTTYLALVLNSIVDRNSSLCVWRSDSEDIGHTFGRQALPMVWDYAETNPASGSTGSWEAALDKTLRVIRHCAAFSCRLAVVHQGTAQRLLYPDGCFHAVVTDPPYYDSVPYSHLADFFYVWLKRTVGNLYPDVFRTPLTPKKPEIVQDRPHTLSTSTKDAAFYEREMTKAFREAARVLEAEGTFVIVFAHKTTAAWETLVSSLLSAGLVVTASWPLHTEMQGRLVAMGTAALASSIFLVCRKRVEAHGGYFNDVRQELQERIQERLEFFWRQGIRGADFFISGIGPAVEVFGRYTAVRRLSGEEVTVGQLLDLVQEIVADYALARILHDGRVGHVDPATRFYVLWRWAYGAARVHFDDARKLAQAQGAEVGALMSQLGLLKKRGENVELLGPRRRAQVKGEHLGEAGPGGQPAPLIDVLHRACLLWNQGDRPGLAEFLSRSGYARDESFWTVAQALSEILPEGDKEKQMLQGLLGSKERVVMEARQERLL